MSNGLCIFFRFGLFQRGQGLGHGAHQIALHAQAGLPDGVLDALGLGRAVGLDHRPNDVEIIKSSTWTTTLSKLPDSMSS